MKPSLKLSDALHILTYIQVFSNGQPLSSAAIAQSINTNPTRVRRLMADLKRAGLMHASAGVAQPGLCKQPAEITILDVYQAVDGESPLLSPDQNTSQDCPVGRQIAQVLDHQYQKVEAAAQAEMQQITLADIMAELDVPAGSRPA
ncbi:Rrf2 family transcriptional regulator [Leuconostocaceae bacterium ESL0723]|nr:Rrf2 family transcriptional regulator [Lactobacillaceae bacterium L1_55_11]WEV54495.1 Rrf2 family transcriptional regulator [Leuconostocaceae bacterium ESL0723]